MNHQKVCVFIFLILVLSCFSTSLNASRVDSKDEEMIKRGYKTNLPVYKYNANGLVEIKEPEDLEMINLLVNGDIRSYYAVTIERGEKVSISLPEEGNYFFVFVGEPNEYAIEIKHNPLGPPGTVDEAFILSEALLIVTGNSSKHKMIINFTRVQEVPSKINNRE
jgi:hypothetical protein